MLDVEPGRVLRLVDAFAAQPPGPPESRLCRVVSELLNVAGVGISLGASGDPLDRVLQTLCATEGGWDGERLQFDLGEGPAYTAHRSGCLVKVPDLACDATWPAFTQAAVGRGVRAVFSFPLRSGSGGPGALTLYRQVAGELSSEQYADAQTAARFALKLMPAAELDRVLTGRLVDCAQLHQASGVASVQLGVPVTAALAVLRAHAFVKGESLAEVATQVVERRLVLGPLR